MLLCMWRCRHLFMLVFLLLFTSDKYPEVELLDYIVVVFLIFENPPLHLYQLATPLAAHRVPFLHIHISIYRSLFWMITILTGVQWYLFVLISIFPITTDVAHVFMYLWDFFGKMCTQVLCQFLIFFLLLNCMSSFFGYKPHSRYMVCI